MDVRERPIIMSADSVRAILAGTKSQTRRVIKPQPEHPWLSHNARGHHWQDGDTVMRWTYGRVGDRLWVRETWTDAHPAQLAEGRFSLPSHAGIPGPPSVQYRTIYKADGDIKPLYFTSEYPYRATHALPSFGGPEPLVEPVWWDSPLYMPRAVSRITLELTAVRVERVQDISDIDLIREGIDPEYVGADQKQIRRSGYQYLWDELNAKRGYSWDSNPWCWVLTFKRIEVA